MLDNLQLHPKVKEQATHIIDFPPHSIGLVAPVGTGKATLANIIACKILNVSLDNLHNQPYIKTILPIKNVISIERIREVTNFIKLKATGSESIKRVIIIQDAHTMTIEAQNALLKTLEEPPLDTVLILTISDISNLLPTIISRLNITNINIPDGVDIINHFTNLGHDRKTVTSYALMSNNRPGLMSALLNNDESHEMINAINLAKKILSEDTFQKLTQIDQIVLSKSTSAVIDALIQISRTAMAIESSKNTCNNDVLKKWTRILSVAEQARENINKNGQPKLVLTDLFLHM